MIKFNIRIETTGAIALLKRSATTPGDDARVADKRARRVRSWY
jgi:hypothetical protein